MLLGLSIFGIFEMVLDRIQQHCWPIFQVLNVLEGKKNTGPKSKVKDHEPLELTNRALTKQLKMLAEEVKELKQGKKSTKVKSTTF